MYHYMFKMWCMVASNARVYDAIYSLKQQVRVLEQLK